MKVRMAGPKETAPAPGKWSDQLSGPESARARSVAMAGRERAMVWDERSSFRRVEAKAIPSRSGAIVGR